MLFYGAWNATFSQARHFLFYKLITLRYVYILALVLKRTPLGSKYVFVHRCLPAFFEEMFLLLSEFQVLYCLEYFNGSQCIKLC